MWHFLCTFFLSRISDKINGILIPSFTQGFYFNKEILSSETFWYYGANTRIFPHFYKETFLRYIRKDKYSKSTLDLQLCGFALACSKLGSLVARKDDESFCGTRDHAVCRNVQQSRKQWQSISQYWKFLLRIERKFSSDDTDIANWMYKLLVNICRANSYRF